MSVPAANTGAATGPAAASSAASASAAAAAAAGAAAPALLAAPPGMDRQESNASNAAAPDTHSTPAPTAAAPGPPAPASAPAQPDVVFVTSSLTLLPRTAERRPASVGHRPGIPTDTAQRDALQARITALTGGLPPLVLARNYRHGLPSHQRDQQPVHNQQQQPHARDGQNGPSDGHRNGHADADADADAESGPCKRWRWLAFTNPARSDSLQLYHWESDPDTVVSRFAQLGVAANVMTYTDDEYEQHLTDPSWTREETDHLFQLCRDYELRFFVIADRYEQAVSRSLEDLKDRYYSVCRALILVRHGIQDIQSKQQSAKFAYDRAREEERKRLLLQLYDRSPAQVEEEERLMHELKKRELREDRWMKDREAILRSLMNHELAHHASTPLLPPISDSPVAGNGAGPSFATSGSVPGTSGVGLAISTSTSGSTGGGGGGSSRRRKRQSNVRGDETPVSATPAPPSAELARVRRREVDESPLRREKLPSGVHLRSSRLTLVKAAVLPKTNAVLEEYGIGITPKMPTANVCAKFDELRQSIVTLLDLKRSLDRTEHEIKVAQTRRKALREESALSAAQTPVPAAPSLKRPFVSPPSQSRDTKRSRN
ncbi:hypothetical protein BC831DRAFT_451797 [Entophlyctis helioformis]|nr:hypothetical protein BC831DRAFT_451797 [Entophlyctis helioformis]